MKSNIAQTPVLTQSSLGKLEIRRVVSHDPDTFHTFKLILAPKFLSIIHKDSTKMMELVTELDRLLERKDKSRKRLH